MTKGMFKASFKLIEKLCVWQMPGVGLSGAYHGTTNSSGGTSGCCQKTRGPLSTLLKC